MSVLEEIDRPEAEPFADEKEAPAVEAPPEAKAEEIPAEIPA
jgi:hypothetical protein